MQIHNNNKVTKTTMGELENRENTGSKIFPISLKHTDALYGRISLLRRLRS